MPAGQPFHGPPPHTSFAPQHMCPGQETPQTPHGYSVPGPVGGVTTGDVWQAKTASRNAARIGRSVARARGWVTFASMGIWRICIVGLAASCLLLATVAVALQARTNALAAELQRARADQTDLSLRVYRVGSRVAAMEDEPTMPPVADPPNPAGIILDLTPTLGREAPAQSAPLLPAPRPAPVVTPLPSLPAAPSDGYLVINSIPPSSVILDGHYLGSTPRTRVPVSPGEHRVEFEIVDRLLRSTMTVHVGSGETRLATARFDSGRPDGF